MPDHGPWNANTVQNTSLFLFQINEVMLLTYKMKPNVIKKKLIGQNMLCKWGLMNHEICDFAVTSSKLCDRKKTQWDFEIRDQIFSGPVYTRQASPVSPAGPLYQADLAHALFPFLPFMKFCLFTSKGRLALLRSRLLEPRSQQKNKPAFLYKHNKNLKRN